MLSHCDFDLLGHAADGVHIDGTLAFADGCDLAFLADFRYFLIARCIAEFRAVLQRFLALLLEHELSLDLGGLSLLQGEGCLLDLDPRDVGALGVLAARRVGHDALGQFDLLALHGLVGHDVELQVLLRVELLAV